MVQARRSTILTVHSWLFATLFTVNDKAVLLYSYRNRILIFVEINQRRFTCMIRADRIPYNKFCCAILNPESIALEDGLEISKINPLEFVK